MSGIGSDEVELRVTTGPSGYVAEIRDGRGLADGMFTKTRRYFYGDTARRDAIRYVEEERDVLRAGGTDAEIVRVAD